MMLTEPDINSNCTENMNNFDVFNAPIFTFNFLSRISQIQFKSLTTSATIILNFTFKNKYTKQELKIEFH